MAAKIVGGKQVHWTMAPENTMKYRRLHVERRPLKVKAESWKDYFFPDIYDLKGS